MFATILPDCETCLSAACADAALAHQIDDLETEHEFLVTRWMRMSTDLGRLAA